MTGSLRADSASEAVVGGSAGMLVVSRGRSVPEREKSLDIGDRQKLETRRRLLQTKRSASFRQNSATESADSIEIYITEAQTRLWDAPGQPEQLFSASHLCTDVTKECRNFKWRDEDDFQGCWWYLTFACFWDKVFGCNVAHFLFIRLFWASVNIFRKKGLIQHNHVVKDFS